MVIFFLRDCCGVPIPLDRPLPVPATWLLDLAAALQLAFWESCGIEPRQVDPDLPDFETALSGVMQQLSPRPAGSSAVRQLGWLHRRVTDAQFECFAWRSREELDAPVVLGQYDEEPALEALADFLWAARPR